MRSPLAMRRRLLVARRGETDDRRILRYGAGFVAYVLLAVALPPFLHPFFFLGLAIHAARGSKQTIEAFTFLMLTIIGHSELMPTNAGLFRWVVLFSGLLRLLWDSTQDRGLRSPVVYAIAVATLAWIPINLVGSFMPTLSVLKVVAFGVGGFTIFGCFERTAHLRHHWQLWFIAFAIVIVIGSLVVLPTDFGYERTVRGYQGILRHPQMLGPVAAVLAAWFSGLLATGRGAPRLLLPLAAAAYMLLLLSAARTGLLAGLGGFALATLFGILLRGQRLISPAYLMSPGAVLTLLLALAYLVGFSNQAEAFFTDFVNKGQEAESATELFEQARGSRMQLSLDNFASSPFIGVGFGTPSDVDRSLEDRSVDRVGGVVVSASSEKGFMPTAVLEETGLLGAALVLVMLSLIFLPIHAHGSFETIWMAWAALLMNVGAAVLFSLGGLGFFLWMMLGFCYNQSGFDLMREQRRVALQRHMAKARRRSLPGTTAPGP